MPLLRLPNYVWEPLRITSWVFRGMEENCPVIDLNFLDNPKVNPRTAISQSLLSVYLREIQLLDFKEGDLIFELLFTHFPWQS